MVTAEVEVGCDGVTEVGVVAAGGRGLSLGLGEVAASVLVVSPFTLFRHLLCSLCCLYLSRSLRLSAQYVTHYNVQISEYIFTSAAVVGSGPGPELHQRHPPGVEPHPPPHRGLRHQAHLGMAS